MEINYIKVDATNPTGVGNKSLCMYVMILAVGGEVLF